MRRSVETSSLTGDSPCPWGEGTLGAALLTPTRLYVKGPVAATRAGTIKGLAHITGGGLTENLPRALPDGLRAEVDLSSWALPGVFGWLADGGGLDQSELLKTFNAGIGMVAIVGHDQVEAARAHLATDGQIVHTIGRVVPGEGVAYTGALA